jgi:hypothetical protein
MRGPGRIDLRRAPHGREEDVVPSKTFEVIIRGRLSPTLVAAVDGFEVSRGDHGLTHLVGSVPDQARIHSLFQLLRDLNIELVSVNPVPSPALG